MTKRNYKQTARIPKSIIQNDYSNTPVETPLKNEVRYSPESQKQRINTIKICKIMTSENRHSLKPYIAELSAALLTLKEVDI